MENEIATDHEDTGELLQSNERPDSISEQSKWLVTSALFHGFGIAIAALMSVVIEIPSDDKPLVLMSNVTERDEQRPDRESITLVRDAIQPLAVEEPLDAQALVNAAVEEVFDRAEEELPVDASHKNVLPESLDALRIPGLGQENAESPGGVLESMENIIGPGGAGNSARTWSASEFGGTVAERGPFPWRMSGLDAHDHRCWCRFRVIHCDGCGEASSLSWLVRHQEADGSWDARKHGASVKSDTAVTGLALLAMLGAGHTERVGSYKETVRKAVAWLKSKQDADGMIWDSTDDPAARRAKGYPCAIASLAMIEAAGMANIPETRASAQKALDYICAHQGSDGGWRYSPKSSGDLSVSGWFVMALKSARVCGFNVPPKNFERAIDFLNSMEVQEPAQGGEPACSRFKYTANDEHAASAHRLAAIGTVMHQFTGTKAEALMGTTEWFVEQGGVPQYGANGEKVDLYYWYYGSLATFQQSKVQPEIWKKWGDAMRTTLANSQCKLGDDHGSWAPAGAYSSEWGRVGQTALSTLCLETWYRYNIVAE